jgi:hypothetical protein
MPNTYVALKTETVAVATPSVTFDLTGISGYTDLVAIVSARSVFSAAEVAGFIRVGNGSIDTGSNYSSTRLLGTGSSASSARATNVTRIPWDAIPGATSASGNFCTTIIHINNYSNSTTFKTFLIRSNEPNNYVEATVGMWRSTSAINQLQIYGDGGANLAVGTVISLYGIANADQGSAKATGGIITEDSTYWYHTFGASGAFIPKQSLTCDVLVVAGGGGGGADMSGGGGAGGLLYFASQSLTAISHNVTVGAGGSGSTGGGTLGTNGVNSQFAALTASVGGGRSGNYLTPNGASGGSGGGAGRQSGGSTGGAASPAGQGNAGGNGSRITSDGETGGGGGAGAAGQSGYSTGSGDGGIGLSTYSSWGIAAGVGHNVDGTVYFAGGGGGGWQDNATVTGSGGFGGGGNGAAAGVVSTAGLANTGGGGGGGAGGGSAGRAGGSGVVIIRYSK